MESNTNSRRAAIQQIGLFATAMSFLPLVSCNEVNDKPTSSTKEKAAPPPFLVPPQEPLTVGTMGSNMRTLIHSAQTNGQFSCVEAVLAPKKIAGSPHTHDSLDELMYVMEGTASLLLGEEVVEVKAGSWHLRPRKTMHVVWNGENENLRLIDMYFNQNFEDYLEEIYHQIIPEVIKRNIGFDEPGIAKRVAALDKKFGLTYYPEKAEALMKKYGLS